MNAANEIANEAFRLGKTIEVTPKNGEPFSAYVSIDRRGLPGEPSEEEPGHPQWRDKAPRERQVQRQPCLQVRRCLSRMGVRRAHLVRRVHRLLPLLRPQMGRQGDAEGALPAEAGQGR